MAESSFLKGRNNINLDGTESDFVFEQQDELIHEKSFTRKLFEHDVQNSICIVISPVVCTVTR